MPWSHIVQGQAPPGAMGKGWEVVSPGQEMQGGQ